LNQTWLFQEGFQIAREPGFERLKRASDIILASLGLILASPILLAACVAIWLEDRGPVLFTQTRIGLNHTPFRIVKLRTMRTSQGPADRYTRIGDSRITKVGQFLRTSRIDEFPQLWNVLRGEMSLIGPRAEWDELVADYQRQIPCYYFRHLVKPGITGWAQVNYPYGANLEDTLRKLEYDLYYIRHFSFLLDASIVLKTIHVMLFGKGR
jgi:lipopolysaccharide/colanic/teichoic acid biosynthesis glycosyltransferase